MKDKNKYQDDRFIARWIAGELSNDEYAKFNQWIASNPEEKKYFDELESTWNSYENLKLKQGSSKEERLEKILNKLI